MGLDQYLYRKSYVQNWNHTPADQRHTVTVHRGGQVRDDIQPERVAYVVEQVAYWSKCNQIHKWFVDKAQGGNDDCGEYLVEHELICQLYELCKQVLASAETCAGPVIEGYNVSPQGWRPITKEGQVMTASAAALAARDLPTQGGFFFGSTEYDEYYLEQLRDTVRQLEPLIKDDRESYYYRSSW